MPHLEISDVHKRYGQVEAAYTALRGLTFSVDCGEFIAVRGPSGCGKSTLLHIIGAMDQPSQGRVLLNGRRLDNLSNEALARVRRRSIGFVFQSFNLLPTLTAVENVALPLTLDGQKEALANRRAQAALDAVGLLSKVGCLPSQLSGGEMQRVAIARALVIEPELVIADEPTGSLDTENGRKILELLSQLNRSRGLTILMATHDGEAASYATRTLTLRDGRLESAADTHGITPSL